MDEFILAVDLGSFEIKFFLAKKRGSAVQIVKAIKVPSFGLRKGEIFDQEEVIQRIKEGISLLKEGISLKEEIRCANIGGIHIKFIPSAGFVSVSRADSKISSEDVERVLKASESVSLPSNFQILENFPQEFIIDGIGGISNPEGLKGVRLEAKVGLIAIFTPSFNTLLNSFKRANFDLDELIPDPLASAKAVLTKQEKELGVLLLDIGAETTKMAVFQEGKLLNLASFPVGSANITNDIAILLRTTIKTAEKIKITYGLKAKSRKIKVKTEEGPLVFSSKMLNEIIKARINEIFSLVGKELKRIFKFKKLPGGVVLTGGGAKLNGIKEIAKEKLKLPSRVGLPSGILGFKPDPSLAVVGGLILAGKETEKEIEIAHGIKEKIKKFFKMFIP